MTEFKHIKQPGLANQLKGQIPEFQGRSALFAVSLQQATGELYLEFGSLTGTTLNELAALVAPKHIYGFDSFEGLPEDWGPEFRQGHFRTDNRPELAENAHMVEGWFEDTLAPFLAEHQGLVAFAHIDSDVYSSASYVLFTLAEHEQLHRGTVLQFDEILAVKEDLWYSGEYDAFIEFVDAFDVEYTWLGHWQESAAVRIDRI
jgi:hypothetical protein